MTRLARFPTDSVPASVRHAEDRRGVRGEGPQRGVLRQPVGDGLGGLERHVPAVAGFVGVQAEPHPGLVQPGGVGVRGVVRVVVLRRPPHHRADDHVDLLLRQFVRQLPGVRGPGDDRGEVELVREREALGDLPFAVRLEEHRLLPPQVRGEGLEPRVRHRADGVAPAARSPPRRRRRRGSVSPSSRNSVSCSIRFFRSVVALRAAAVERVVAAFGPRPVDLQAGLQFHHHVRGGPAGQLRHAGLPGDQPADGADQGVRHAAGPGDGDQFAVAVEGDAGPQVRLEVAALAVVLRLGDLADLRQAQLRPGVEQAGGDRQAGDVQHRHAVRHVHVGPTAPTALIMPSSHDQHAVLDHAALAEVVVAGVQRRPGQGERAAGGRGQVEPSGRAGPGAGKTHFGGFFVRSTIRGFDIAVTPPRSDRSRTSPSMTVVSTRVKLLSGWAL